MCARTTATSSSGCARVAEEMLAVGERVPEATVWLGPRDEVTISELCEEGPLLLFFYLFDWSAT
jgi:hypothetical protein